MDLPDASVHAGATGASVGLGWLVSSLLGWRKREREEDAAAKREEAFTGLRERVAVLERELAASRDGHREVVALVREMRAELRQEIEAMEARLQASLAQCQALCPRESPAR